MSITEPYDIIAVHIVTRPDLKHEVTVAIQSADDGWWKAYKSNSKRLAGYPLHDTSKLDEQCYQRVAATGIKLTKAEATKLFQGPEFPVDKNENE